MQNKFKNKKIVLGVCSSIAIYKSAQLVSELVKLGADVTVVMTSNACKLMSPRIFQTLSKNQVFTSMWENVVDWKPEHISLAESADLFIVAPATANTIGNFANGLAPDILSSLYLATNAKTLIAPAMNSNMYTHPAVEHNIKVLKDRNVEFIDADYGMLACGIEGKGRLAKIENIIEVASTLCK